MLAGASMANTGDIIAELLRFRAARAWLSGDMSCRDAAVARLAACKAVFALSTASLLSTSAGPPRTTMSSIASIVRRLTSSSCPVSYSSLCTVDKYRKRANRATEGTTECPRSSIAGIVSGASITSTDGCGSWNSLDSGAGSTALGSYMSSNLP